MTQPRQAVVVPPGSAAIGGTLYAVSQTTKQQVLSRAVDLGGLEEVALALNAPSRLVEAWLRGVAVMPDGHVLLLAEFLCQHAGRDES